MSNYCHRYQHKQVILLVKLTTKREKKIGQEENPV